MSADPTEGVKESLASIDPYQFEKFVAALWERRGWTTEVTSASKDAGIDVIIEKSSPFNQTQIIQAKRNASDNKVGSSDIQQYSSLKHQVPNADTVIVVTTSKFTSPAEQRAEELNVKLVDGSTLLKIIEGEDAYDLVREFTQSVPTDNSANHQPSTNKTDEVTLDSETVDVQDNDTKIDEEMSTSEAVVAVIQGLVALAIVIGILYLIAITLLF
ncbi:restriction endonuclease [Haloarcula amylolytica]|uniref:restriction endonuclease n=1 Tax=Haloarcula amylolytica TaxID=396317 RepID=UPI003C769337